MTLPARRLLTLAAAALCLTAVLATNASAAAPANDNWADAIEITDFDQSFAGTTIDATNEVGEPQSSIGSHPRSVWYKFTPDVDMRIGFDTCQTGDNGKSTFLAIYMGGAGTPPMELLGNIAFNEVGCTQSLPGHAKMFYDNFWGDYTYWLAVSDRTAGDDGQDFTLRVMEAPEVETPPSITSDGDVWSYNEDAVFSGGGTITTSLEWQRCDVDGSNCAAIGGATGTEYTTVALDDGKRLKLVVTGTNFAAEAYGGSNLSSVIGVDEEINVTANPALTGIAAFGRTLLLNPGTAENTPGENPGVEPPTFSVEWLACVDPEEESSCQEGFGDNTSSEYVPKESNTLEESDGNRYIVAVVTWTNSDGSEEVVRSNASDLVVDLCVDEFQDADKTNGCPEIGVIVTGQPVLSGTAQVGQTLSLSDVGSAENESTSDPTVPAPTHESTFWSSCPNIESINSCPLISGENGTSYTVRPEDVGNIIVARLRWGNTEGSANSIAFTSVVTAAPDPPAEAPVPFDLGQLKLPKKISVKDVVKKKGKFTVSNVMLACPLGMPACKFSVSVTAKVKKKTVKLGSSSFTIKPGEAGLLSGKLSKSGLKHFKSKKSLKAQLSLKGSGGSKGKAVFKDFRVKK